MTVIDRICLQNKVDLRLNVRLSPYGCVATGDETGMIEITRKSDTIARMQWAYGGAFDIKPIYSQIKSKCATPAALAKATDNFNRSCSGYTVATYVMGIGDRHPSNIMMTDNGESGVGILNCGRRRGKVLCVWVFKVCVC